MKEIERAEELLEQVRSKRGKTILFCAGYCGRRIVFLLNNRYGLDIDYFFDNDKYNVGKKMGATSVCQSPFFVDENCVLFISIFSIRIAQRIYDQSKALGYKNIYYIGEKCIVDLEYGMADDEYLKYLYYCKFEKNLNLDNPILYNEKIQWLKLHDRNKKYTILSDKYAVKDYVAKRIGSKYIIPTIGLWENYNDIDFDKMPDSFVLKCTHDSGSVEIVQNKRTIDHKALREKFDKALSQDYAYVGREYNYMNIPRRIIAEPLLVEDEKKQIKDYKVFCFDGEPRIVQVDYDRFSNHTRVMYSTSWESLEFSTLYPYGKDKIEAKPQKLDELLDLAAKLSKEIIHVRVDFYIVKNQIYFGEMTFHHGGGMEIFSDEKWNYIMGSWINLEEIKERK